MWLIHVNKFRLQNPNMSYKDCLKGAKLTYTKGGQLLPAKPIKLKRAKAEKAVKVEKAEKAVKVEKKVKVVKKAKKEKKASKMD
jgi:hypothetical protein